MFKRTLGLIAATVFASGTMANTTTPTDTELAAANGIECYPLAHGENGLGSRASITIPPFLASGANRWQLYATNIGETAVNVSLKLFDENGQRWFPSGTTAVSYLGKFSASNTPIVSLNDEGPAKLSSLNSGWIGIDDRAPQNVLSGALTWQADKCLTEPTLSPSIDILAEYGNTRDHGRNITVNGGNPF